MTEMGVSGAASDLRAAHSVAQVLQMCIRDRGAADKADDKIISLNQKMPKR